MRGQNFIFQKAEYAYFLISVPHTVLEKFSQEAFN